MRKSRFFLVFSILFTCSLSVRAQGPADPSGLFSPSVGKRFYEVAYELVNSPDISSAETEQAIIFLTAAITLDSRANYVHPVLLRLSCRHPERDYSRLVYHLLENYIDDKADLEPVRKAVHYLLEQLNSREQREALLGEMLKNLGGKSDVLYSELATELGLLMAEKTDDPNAVKFFWLAYSKNKYNKLAFAKLAELAGEHLAPAMYLEYLRLRLGENPLDTEAAVAFAQYAEELQLYETAADAYEYCADLFRFLYPLQPLPASIYLPWSISSYNTKRHQHRCLKIAEQFRQSGGFDILLEAIAGKAAAKIGNQQQATGILQAAEDKALELVDYERRTPNYEQLAWFYCFASPDADKALQWANKAYSIETNSPTAAAILAYSLVMNQQAEWAKTLIDNYEHNQIADLTLAQIQLRQGQRDSAIETLKSAIARDPGALEAERAKEILAQQGGEYIPPIDPNIVLTALKDSFGETVVPTFVSPENLISVRLNVRGSKFSYGSEFGGTIAITNNSSEPLIISDDGLFAGNIRIDAAISGDLTNKIPNLISVKVRPGLPVEPGRSFFIPLRLLTAELKQTLLTYPQASLDIEFTAYLDPVITDEGSIANRLRDIKPARVPVKRPGVELSGKFLRNRLNSLSTGRQGQKITTAQLFIGLLAEQHAMATQEPPYKFMHADWMEDMLKSALVHNLGDDDWVVKVDTMAGLLSLPLDHELIKGAAKNLNDTHWPARMMAIYLLAKNQNSNFGKVLDWTAKYDSNKLVRDMAIALGTAGLQAPEPGNPPTEPKKLLPISQE
jgi:tetratricopeptide (TPR) repeat protein